MKGTNIYIRAFTEDDTDALLQLQTENRTFFEAFAMDRSEDFYTRETQLKRINQFAEDIKHGNGYYMGIFKNNDHLLVGTINLFSVLRGSLQTAFLGYFLDEKHNGRGYTTEAVKLIVRFAFDELKLHRVEAGVMPRNIASIRVLEKAGFHKEGIAKSNVRINGKWEDHQVLAIINPAD
ncbi:GNAT family N-acetyltransferase [Thalassobacillus devorans]|uniref:GNAT family N-acetyltransferase n=1 Tax=Thalassobacillus devorans TaxID=279813 RepID=UPI000A1CBF8A|nr:GNAT family protein [Thalassobacillus devorans]